MYVYSKYAPDRPTDRPGICMQTWRANVTGVWDGRADRRSCTGDSGREETNKRAGRTVGQSGRWTSTGDSGREDFLFFGVQGLGKLKDNQTGG